MDRNNQKKYDLLGMPYGTATNQLRKAIMFQLIQETGKDICYRCGEKIERVEDLSIEHKRSWQLAENPKDVFFDLNNITFSHLSCNITAADRTHKPLGKTGFRGVYKENKGRKKPYRATLWKDKKNITLGRFETPEKALEEYNKAINNKN